MLPKFNNYFCGTKEIYYLSSTSTIYGDTIMSLMKLLLRPIRTSVKHLSWIVQHKTVIQLTLALLSVKWYPNREIGNNVILKAHVGISDTA